MAAETWDCPTCGQPRHTRYCGDCGERALHRHDLTLVGLGEEAIEAVAHVDGRVFRTLRTLLTRPGQLTVAYIRGQRKPLLGPLQVFLIANVVFFAFQTVFHANVFASGLDSQIHHQFYKSLAARLVDARLGSQQATIDTFAPAFDHAAKVNAKSLIVLMTPPLAIVAAFAFWMRRRPFVTHVAFALHFYAFWLLAFCISAPILAIALGVFMKVAGVRLTSDAIDAVAAVVFVGWAAVYLALAAGRVYEIRGVWRAMGAAALTLTAAAAFIGYRFAIFIITLYTTSI